MADASDVCIIQWYSITVEVWPMTRKETTQSSARTTQKSMTISAEKRASWDESLNGVKAIFDKMQAGGDGTLSADALLQVSPLPTIPLSQYPTTPLDSIFAPDGTLYFCTNNHANSSAIDRRSLNGSGTNFSLLGLPLLLWRG